MRTSGKPNGTSGTPPGMPGLSMNTASAPLSTLSSARSGSLRSSTGRRTGKGLQRKVQEQRRTIKRLEAKVRKLGAQPYTAETTEDTTKKDATQWNQ